MLTSTISSYQFLQQESWTKPAYPIRLKDSVVHVWRFSLEQPDRRVYDFVQFLSDDERAQAASLYRIRDRKRFIIGRGILRTILASYMNTEPSRLQFHHNPYGKPFLSRVCSCEDPFQFNLTHSQGLALCAVSNHCLGIDMEHVNPVLYIDAATNTLFPESEAETIAKLPKNKRTEAFYDAWTREEAYLKASGDGLCGPHNKTESGPTGLCREEIDGSSYSIISMKPASNYIATLVVEGHNFSLNYFHFD
ncbi:4'-phosphopantetheinyl transferase superfamily protein [Candidatus Bathyarchaeota archaeon]|nr:4'-phosphopantetheinyl transferase superfamily protein [Candidatus Bathyarchaeota archaeon]